MSYGKGKEKVKQHKLRGKDKTKYQVHDGVKDALSRSTNWTDFEKLLKEKGIGIAYKYKGQTDEVQGISFTIDKTTFKGSDIDRSFSYSKLDKLLQEKAQKQRKEQEQSQSINQSSNQNINNKPKGIRR